MLKKVTDYLICFTILFIPLYLVKFQIFGIPLNILEVCIYLTFISWLVESHKLKWDKKWLYPIILIVLGVSLSVIFSANIIKSAGIWKSWFIAPLLLFFVLVSKPYLKNRIIMYLYLSAMMISCVSLFYWFKGDLTYDGRLASIYNSPNYLAMYLSPIFILSFYFIRRVGIFPKLIWLLGDSLLIFIIILTFSQGAWLGILSALVFLSVFELKNTKVRNIALFLLVFICVFLISISYYQPSALSRIMIWKSASRMIRDNPLMGIGPGMFQDYYLNYQQYFPPYPQWAVPQPHNIFLAFWLQSGILGLIGFVWLLSVLFSYLKENNTAFLAALFCILGHGVVDTTYWKNDLAVLFWIIVFLITLSYREDYHSGLQK